MTRYHGWIFKDEVSGKLSLKLNYEGRSYDKEFPDSPSGAEQLADYVTHHLGEQWRMEKAGFLGYRIFVKVKE